MMKYVISIFLAAMMAVSVSGCAEHPGAPGITNEQGGTVVGAVAGGLLGSTIGSGGGRAVATVAGAAIGAFVGNQVGASMDAAARERYERATRRAMSSGHRTHFHTDHVDGYVTPHPRYRNDEGLMCRRFTSRVIIDGRKQFARGVACYDEHRGEWRVM